MVRFGMKALAAVAGLAALGVTPAQAVLTIRVTQTGGNTLTVADGSADDINPNADAIIVRTSAITTAFASLDPGSAFNADYTIIGDTAQLNNNTRIINTRGAGSLEFTVEASRDNAIIPGADAKTILGTVSGTFINGPSTQEFLLGADAANALFAINTVTLDTPEFSSPDAFGAGPVSVNFGDINPFSVTNWAIYTVGDDATVQSTSSQILNAAAVPAPAGLLLAAAALPVFGLRRVLRRKAA